jgi:hypothetical protein
MCMMGPDYLRGMGEVLASALMIMAGNVQFSLTFYGGLWFWMRPTKEILFLY